MKTAAQYRKARARRMFWREIERCSGLILVNVLLVCVAAVAFAVNFGPYL